MPDLASLLHTTFGHTAFRANQEAVCVAATAGRDVLLVMPTGAGKSLCYQLPALARQSSGEPSTALVISPLIALMDDQAAKLSSHGLRVARIHSGLSREDTRQACRDYLDGNLNFLFVAPERMRVPGFPEMLARRKPSLVAIDEAHCISAWGHDFRPDYRTLGEHLPALRPAPIIALTATATPTVQRDIVAQLHLNNPALFIHGFRRANLAIEVVEMSKPRRHDFATELLADPASRPAIVYAPSRKAAEELAAHLNSTLRKSSDDKFPGAPSIALHAMGGIDKLPGHNLPGAPSIALHAMGGIDKNSGHKLPGTPSIALHAMGGINKAPKKIAAPYHAGLDPSTRERVQSAFQSGSLEVVVATIAFGMGIDKADVRTVIHTALPASVEAFYQEIGRAGRDGLPSRTVLLHSYADRKMHEFFLDRDYPPVSDLARVAAVLTEDLLMPEPLAQRLKMDLPAFNKAIEKLIAQGIASTDLAGNVRLSSSPLPADSWRSSYDAQIAFRRGQIDRMATFAETQQCRMTAIIRHFGDTADAHRPCGVCDFCSPTTTSAQTFAPPTPAQTRDLLAILRTLSQPRSPGSTGKLFTDLEPTLQSVSDRRAFDILLDALARAGLLTLTSETFTNSEGRTLPYKKPTLTHEGRADDAHELTGVLLPAASPSSAPSSKRKRTTKSGAPGQAALSPDLGIPLTPTQQLLETSLRAWRKSEAAKTGKPAFIVLSDAVLRNIAVAQPQTIPQLITIPGIGPNKADQLGPAIIAICRNESSSTPQTTSTVRTVPQSPKPSGMALPFRPDHDPQGPKARHIPSQAAGLGTLAHKSPSAEGATQTLRRPRPSTPDPTSELTPDQLLLDAALRTWRKSEAERLNLPQFFVLGASTLRAIVLARPRTLAQLETIPGIGPDKLEKFGPAILALSNA